MPAPTLPFASLNLRRNPFGEWHPHERPAWAVVDVEAWVAPLRGRRFAVQFIDDKGRGKTTHLMALRERFAQAYPEVATFYVRMPEHGPLPALPSGVSPLFIDEIQRLGWWGRRRLLRRGQALAIGTHEDLTPALTRAGYQVRTVRPSAAMNLDRLRTLTQRRIEACRRGPGPVPALEAGLLEELFRRHGDDVRAIEGELYAVFQAMERT